MGLLPRPASGDVRAPRRCAGGDAPSGRRRGLGLSPPGPMIRRREFLAAVTAAAVAPSSPAWAQTPRKHRVAWLAQGDRESTSAFFDALREGLREFGYDEG